MQCRLGSGRISPPAGFNPGPHGPKSILYIDSDGGLKVENSK